MDWFSGQAPRAKESLDKGREEECKMGGCLLLLLLLLIRRLFAAFCLCLSLFKDMHPVRKKGPHVKESLDKDGEEGRKIRGRLLPCLFVDFSLLFVFFVLSVRALLALVCFSCVVGHASKLVFAWKWKGVSTENNFLDFRSGNTFLY